MNCWKKYGDILVPQTERNIHFLSNFTAAAEPLDDENWRIWYSASSGGANFNIAFAEGVPGDNMQEHTAILSPEKSIRNKQFTICNLPEGWLPTQPVHIVLPNGTQRLYFWAHGPGVVRYLAADSSDGINYTVVDPYKPCLYHPCDRAVSMELNEAAGLVIGKKDMERPTFEQAADTNLICNDATNVYLLDDGTFELYTVELIQVDKSDPRYITHDNAAGLIRVIERRTSKDGLNWSPGTRVLEPDSQDPADLQFYYLSVTHTPQGRIGILGHYGVEAQTMDLEWCFSKDGINWERPNRTPWLNRDEDASGHYAYYAPHKMVFHQGEWWLFYTACNYTHNHEKSSGPLQSKIQLARIDQII